MKPLPTPRTAAWRLALALLAAGPLLLSNCKKDSAAPAPAPPSVVGNWTGKYSLSPTTALNTDWNLMTLSADGSLTGSNRQGTYSVAGTVLTATYRLNNGIPLTFSFRCNITDNATKLTGTWGNGTSETNGGQLLLNK